MKSVTLTILQTQSLILNKLLGDKMAMDEQQSANFYMKEFRSLKEKTNKLITLL